MILIIIGIMLALFIFKPEWRLVIGAIAATAIICNYQYLILLVYVVRCLLPGSGGC